MIVNIIYLFKHNLFISIILITMFKIISKIGAITTPAFIAVHLINQNKDKTSKYCPVIKYKKSIYKTPTNTTETTDKTV